MNTKQRNIVELLCKWQESGEQYTTSFIDWIDKNTTLLPDYGFFSAKEVIDTLKIKYGKTLNLHIILQTRI